MAMDRRTLIFTGALAGAISAPPLAATAPAGASEARLPAGWKEAWSRAVADFHDDLTASGVVGGGFAFCHDGEMLAFEPHGYQDVATKQPVDIETIYHWASITKTFTAIAFMQLRDRGLVSLDEPAVKYCPEMARIHDPFGRVDQITLEHLLTHSSGLREPTFPWGGDKPWQPHEPKRWDQVAAMMPYTEIEFRPGSKYSYSNLGLSLIGRVIETVSGDIYQQYVIKNVLTPLGMERTYFDRTPWGLAPHRGHNYYVDGGEITDNGPEVLTGATVANGGLNAPIGDFVRYTSFLLGLGDPVRDQIVVRPATLAEMWRPNHLTDEQIPPSIKEQMGECFFIIDFGGPANSVRYVGHTGSQLGYLSFFYLRPQTRSAVIWVVNSSARTNFRAMVFAQRRKLFEGLFPLFES